MVLNILTLQRVAVFLQTFVNYVFKQYSFNVLLCRLRWKYRLIFFFSVTSYLSVSIFRVNTVDSRYLDVAYLVNRLSRTGNLVPLLTHRSTNRQQNIVEKRRNCSKGAISPLFHNIYNLSLTVVKLHTHSVKNGCSIYCFPQFRKSDMSKYGYLEVFIVSLGFRDNEIDCIYYATTPMQSILYCLMTFVP